jgi:hypothetical protein
MMIGTGSYISLYEMRVVDKSNKAYDPTQLYYAIQIDYKDGRATGFKVQQITEQQYRTYVKNKRKEKSHPNENVECPRRPDTRMLRSSATRIRLHQCRANRVRECWRAPRRGTDAARLERSGVCAQRSHALHARNTGQRRELQFRCEVWHRPRGIRADDG